MTTKFFLFPLTSALFEDGLLFSLFPFLMTMALRVTLLFSLSLSLVCFSGFLGTLDFPYAKL